MKRPSNVDRFPTIGPHLIDDRTPAYAETGPPDSVAAQRAIVPGRDTCVGACETPAGCSCISSCPPCNQRCNQGRKCPAVCRFDTDDERPPMTSREARKLLLVIFSLWAVVIGITRLWLAFN